MFIRKLSIKLGVFALSIFLIIPFSTYISRIIENTYSDMTKLQHIIDENELLNEEIKKEVVDTNQEMQTENNDDNNKELNTNNNNILDNIKNVLQNVQTKVTNTASNAVSIAQEKTNEWINKLTEQLNKLIETIAIMLITTCVIPILVIFGFIWLAKLIFTVDVNFDSKMMTKFFHHK